MSNVTSIGKNQVGRVKSLDYGELTKESDYGVWDAEIKAAMDNRTLKGYFFNEDWVFIVLDLLCSEIANAQMLVYRKDSDTEVTPLPNHPLSAMIENPNPWQDYSTWMYLHAVEVNLMGNGIQWFAENTMQMIILPADLIHLDFADSNTLKHYMVHSDGSHFIETGIIDSMVFSAEDILHQRRPNPSNMIWGLSPFIPNRKSILFNRYTQDYLNAFYLKGATPQMALHMEKNASEDSALRMLRSFEMSYTGRRNQRRTLVLPKGVKAESMSHSIGDQRLTDVSNMNLDKILNILRIPKHALSLAKAGSLGSEEHKMALKFFHTSAVNPQKKRIAGTFTQFFRDRGLLKNNEFFQFDNSNVEILKEDELKRADLAKKQMGVKTVNEIRADLYKLPPLSGGDVVILAPGQFAGESPNLVITANPSMPTPPEPEETEEDKQVEVDSVKALLDNRYKEWWANNRKAIEDETNKKEEQILDLSLRLFATVAEEVVDIVKEVIRTKDDEEDLRKIEREIERLFKELEEAYQRDYRNALRVTVDVGYQSNLEIIQNDDVRSAVAAIGTEGVNQRRAILEARGIATFANISKTSTEAIMRIVEDGLQRGLASTEIARQIVESPVTGISSSARAQKIARTEVFTAISIGKLAVLEDTQKIVPGLKKAWITANDERVRDTHISNQRQGPIDADKKFSNGLKYPRDIEGSAKEVINCRCDLLMIPPDDLSDLELPEA